MSGLTINGPAKRCGHPRAMANQTMALARARLARVRKGERPDSAA
jgi:hypothetical protein